ncbi:U-box domain-containing protein 25 [Dorcoceras hygrometricum]|uniref:U-box domain-containing protein 25 n=1 Tax=Dorcoceras hygrometricum TaxID=472368 RepID=A0A2Z7APZ8_9LAMI|nr:U-box domain-containing protein 25 [Dorcoceras hygrometricum]
MLNQDNSYQDKLVSHPLSVLTAMMTSSVRRGKRCALFRLATGYPAAGSATPFRGPVDGLPFCDFSVRSTGCPALVFSKQRLVVQL